MVLLGENLQLSMPDDYVVCFVDVNFNLCEI